jgi:hypothetical protein
MGYKSISGKIALPQGTKVKFKYFGMDLKEIKGSGKIVGIGSELPVLGFMYIIECDDKISDEYPYYSFVCPETYLETY